MNERRRVILIRTITHGDWHPLIDSDDGEVLRSLQALGWVNLYIDGPGYRATVTERGLDRYSAWSSS